MKLSAEISKKEFGGDLLDCVGRFSGKDVEQVHPCLRWSSDPDGTGSGFDSRGQPECHECGHVMRSPLKMDTRTVNTVISDITTFQGRAKGIGRSNGMIENILWKRDTS